MKRISFLFLFLWVCASTSMAQTSALNFVSPHSGLDADQNKVLTYVSNLPRIGDLKHIEWAGQGPVGNDGNINIVLPNENGGQPIIFKVTASDYSSPTEYALLGTSAAGEIAVYVTPQGTGGTIDLATTTYNLYPLGGNKGLLIEKSLLEPENGICGIDNTSPENTNHIDFCEEDCGNAVLDVLAMVTPQANQWITDNWGVIGGWFLFAETHNINLAFANSAVFNKRVRVRIINYTPNFLLTNNMVTDLNALSANADAQLTLQQSGADVGILLTNQNYGAGVFGRSNSVDPFSTNKFCIAQVAFINPVRYTFAHELAHQLGCLHSNPFTTGCPHGRNMPNGRNTIMANDAADNTRIQHFSNPDIFFAGEATGEDGTRNNAAQILGALCEVTNNNTPSLFSANFEHEQIVCEGIPFWASSTSDGRFMESLFGLVECQGPYTYQWSWSTHPSFASSYNIGTNSPWLALAEPPHCPQFYLRLTVTAAGGFCSTSTFTKFIKCQPGPCERSSKPSMTAGQPTNQVVPNPANDRITFPSEGIGEVKRLSVVNAAGIVREISPMSISNEGVITVDIGDLTAGIWFAHIQGADKNLTLRFVVVR